MSPKRLCTFSYMRIFIKSNNSQIKNEKWHKIKLKKKKKYYKWQSTVENDWSSMHTFQQDKQRRNKITSKIRQYSQGVENKAQIIYSLFSNVIKIRYQYLSMEWKNFFKKTIDWTQNKIKRLKFNENLEIRTDNETKFRHKRNFIQFYFPFKINGENLL